MPRVWLVQGLCPSICGWSPCAKVWGGPREAGSDSSLMYLSVISAGAASPAEEGTILPQHCIFIKECCAASLVLLWFVCGLGRGGWFALPRSLSSRELTVQSKKLWEAFWEVSSSNTFSEPPEFDLPLHHTGHPVPSLNHT